MPARRVFALIFGSFLVACASGDGAANGNDDATSPDSGGFETSDAMRDVIPDAAIDTHEAATLDADVRDDGTPAETGSVLVPAAVTCAPTKKACDGATDSTIRANFRKDFYYPYSQYPEASIPDPKDGGRVQIVATSAVAGHVTSVEVNGVDAETSLTSGALDWYHVWPEDLAVGDPIWVTFHSSNASWDATTSGTVAVHTDHGDAISGGFPVQKAPVPLTYVTTNAARDRLLVFAQNRDSVAHTLSALFVDGRDVTDAACIPKKTLAPNETALWTVPLCTKLAAGGAWTVAATFADAPDAVGAGRAITTFFPIEYWPSSKQCSVPGGDASLYADVQSHGLDTIFAQLDWSKCPSGVTPASFASSLASTNFHAIVQSDTTAFPGPYDDTSHVDAVLVADEADSSLGTPSDPTSGPKALAKRAAQFWRTEPAVAVYAGGSRHRHGGAFAGSTDIQGMDFYVAACAPHVTDFGTAPPLRGAYDYGVAYRENQMPLPTWLYTQGQSSAWNATVPLIGTKVDRQPEAAEARVEAYSVMAAGGKGLMYFQIDLDEAHASPRNEATWKEIAAIDHEFRGVRAIVQAATPTGAATATSKDAIVEALRGEDAIVVPVIDLATTAGPTDAGCALAQDMHWALDARTFDVRVSIPDDFAVGDVFEVVGAGLVEVSTSVSGRNVVIGGVSVDETRPTRLFVLARNPSVRAAVTAAL